MVGDCPQKKAPFQERRERTVAPDQGVRAQEGALKERWACVERRLSKSPKSTEMLVTLWMTWIFTEIHEKIELWMWDKTQDQQANSDQQSERPDASGAFGPRSQLQETVCKAWGFKCMGLGASHAEETPSSQLWGQHTHLGIRPGQVWRNTQWERNGGCFWMVELCMNIIFLFLLIWISKMYNTHIACFLKDASLKTLTATYFPYDNTVQITGLRPGSWRTK